MSRRASDGAGLLGAFQRAAQHLEDHAAEVDDLNVFPVPDGDTGANMVATVRAALSETSQLDPEERSVGRVLAALNRGALVGARGNSGVILSQLMRGMTLVIGERRRINALDLAAAFERAATTASGVVAKPVEGTILTVAREAASAAVEAAERRADLEAVLAATVMAARIAVQRTPDQLPILREAGVVDAGGMGLLRLLEGALAFVRAVDPGPAVGSQDGRAAGRTTLVAGTDLDVGFGYETMFLVQARGTDESLDLDAVRQHLQSLGDSVLVAGDAHALKVHVHGEDPERVLTYGRSLGAISRVSVESLDHQVRERSGFAETTNAAARNGSASAPMKHVDVAGSVVESRAGEGRQQGTASLAVLAVVAGDGLLEAYRSFGVQALLVGQVPGRPSAGELATALQGMDEADVLVLPNHPDVILPAEQAATLVTGCAVHVVPTRNPAEGLAALLAMDPLRSAAANARQMLEAARSVQTVQITRAGRDARIQGRWIHAGQAIALAPEQQVVAVADDLIEAALEGVAAFPSDIELMTVYYGASAELASAESLAARLVAARPGVDVEVVRGGQPRYAFLVAGE
jgi:fatty acid kinase